MSQDPKALSLADLKALLRRLNFELALYPDPEPARVSFDLTPTEARTLFEAAERGAALAEHETLVNIDALTRALALTLPAAINSLRPHKGAGPLSDIPVPDKHDDGAAAFVEKWAYRRNPPWGKLEEEEEEE